MSSVTPEVHAQLLASVPGDVGEVREGLGGKSTGKLADVVRRAVPDNIIAAVS